VQALVDEINRLSASQQDEPGVSSEDKSADGSDPIPAQGADTLDWQREDREQYTAEALLNDPQLIEMWLRGVNHDPANFLATKFNMQLEAQPSREVSQ
jgi:Ca-activated chloride channel family protein